MKRILYTSLYLGLLVVLSGCPPEESGYFPDTPLNVKNVSSDSIHLRFIYQRSDFADSLILKSEIDQSSLFSADDDLGMKLASTEMKEYIKVSKEGIENAPFSLYIFLINRDTLIEHSPETWDGETGVKRYFFYDLDDYEQINYTMEYP